jgi:hypothetical protein
MPCEYCCELLCVVRHCGENEEVNLGPCYPRLSLAMAEYNYDGGLAAYFLLTFLALILIPLTWSLVANLSKYSRHLDLHFALTSQI